MIRTIYSPKTLSRLTKWICMISAIEAFALLLVGILQVAGKLNVHTTFSRVYGFIPITISVIVVLTCVLLIVGVIWQNRLFVLPWLIGNAIYLCGELAAWFMMIFIVNSALIAVAIPRIMFTVGFYVVVLVYYRNFKGRRNWASGQINYHPISPDPTERTTPHSYSTVNTEHLIPQESQEFNPPSIASSSAARLLERRSGPQVLPQDTGPPPYSFFVGCAPATRDPTPQLKHLQRDLPVGSAHIPQRNAKDLEQPSSWSAMANVPTRLNSMPPVHRRQCKLPLHSHPNIDQSFTSNGHYRHQSTVLLRGGVGQSENVELWEEQV